jgi:hypothetical protein
MQIPDRESNNALGQLKTLLFESRPAADDIRRRLDQVRNDLLQHSATLRSGNFTAIGSNDLAALFAAYDERFFGGLVHAAISPRPVRFRLSRRMTRAGGKTTRFASRSGEEAFEIAVAVEMLFDCFRDDDRSVAVCGLVCRDRVEALQRIFEHELVHLVELLCCGNSDCAAERFQRIAGGLFLHQSHKHELVTRVERAARAGIRVGGRVSFLCEGKRLSGRVNRITKRATVLVPDPTGVAYSDGCRYRVYYVPLALLQPNE